MAMDSDLLGQGMCARWRKGEAPAGDFQWASHFKVVPQQVRKTDQKRAQLGGKGPLSAIIPCYCQTLSLH